MLSVVIPVCNEAGTLEELYARIKRVLDQQKQPYEIVFIDDGSTDGTTRLLEKLCDTGQDITVLTFRRNQGKALALAAGVRYVTGDIVITLDADLQDQPEDIPLLLDALDAGYDMVSGWRRNRQDPVLKRWLSKIYNWTTRWVTGVPLHDFNCGFKAYRSELFNHVKLYGDLHRYIPVLAAWRGYRVTEIIVHHHPRLHGRTKYGAARLLHGLLDLLTVVFLMRYDWRPSHFFGGLGTVLSVGGLGINCYLSGLWVLGYGPIGDRPLLLLGVLLLIVGIQFVLFGLLAEFILYSRIQGDTRYLEDVMATTRTATTRTTAGHGPDHRA